MPTYRPDPELNRLVDELNRTDQPDRGTISISALPLEEKPFDQRLGSILEAMHRIEATDLLLIPNVAPVFRIHGEMKVSDLDSLDADEIRGMVTAHMTPRSLEQFEREGAADFSIGIASESQQLRFRINLHRQRGKPAAAIRLLPQQIPTLAELQLPSALAELTVPNRGLVLMTGPTGAGKSTTLAAMIGEINRSRARHVITIEDPIEYEHQNGRSIIEQIEIGRDAPTFAGALRAALRQDPDVILVGEMRDLETMSTALTAAETGHLIFSTLHTGDAAQAISRIVDVFPSNQQLQIRHQLSLALNAIVAQQLVPTADGHGRVPAVEVLVANYAVRNHIRHNRLPQLVSELTLGKRQGMISLEESLATLVRNGTITAEEAKMRSRRSDEMEALLRGTEPRG
ncbi:MAG: PilT/PilU family type 4a pilus ATPase [Thermoanaerobaculia bacterium]